MDLDRADPKGLVRESYAIEGITPGECRSVFLDWALSLAAGVEPAEAMRVLLVRYGEGAPGHPMTAVLRAGLTGAAPPRRRGGRAGRVSQ
ncbi:hypothetical protein [Frigidibacter mobilis]|uniref:Uncharacterized protein n=1 Tax=Frigidibacter mobilis TaxID=1335048 RepID=A0A159Z2X7_9RHOB|nr:hypothetical protein [Frigidibacter mobilis]AMY69351.1 hypothetical protein AKL17_2105 [Frigidibacter mobilis]